MNDRNWSDVYFASVGYKDIVGERRGIELAKFTIVKACARDRLPRSATEVFQLAKELFTDGAGLERGLLPEPSHSGQRVTFDREVAAWLKVLD
jgi:hypothetical protein